MKNNKLWTIGAIAAFLGIATLHTKSSNNQQLVQQEVAIIIATETYGGGLGIYLQSISNTNDMQLLDKTSLARTLANFASNGYNIYNVNGTVSFYMVKRVN